METELILRSQHDVDLDDPHELAHLLAKAALAGGAESFLTAMLLTRGNLQKAGNYGPGQYDHLAEPIPERWLVQLVAESGQAYQRTAETIADNVDRWLAAKMGRAVRKSGAAPPAYFLKPVDVQELVGLINANWRTAIYGTAEVDVPAAVFSKYARMGLTVPDTNLMATVSDSLSIGRLMAVLDDAATLDEARKLAAEKPWSRVQELAAQLAEGQAAAHMVGVGRRLAEDETYALVLQQNRETVRDLIGQYMRGDLPETMRNAARLRAQEMAALERPGRHVSGWRDLARELRNRMLAEDGGNRDWMRVATTETRAAANLGFLTDLLDQGQPPEETTIYFLVQPTACEYCKLLYLNPDGTPKLFTLAEIMANVFATGGMNIGRRASLIGKEGGWVANAQTHPFCQCRPRMLRPGATPIIISRPLTPPRG